MDIMTAEGVMEMSEEPKEPKKKGAAKGSRTGSEWRRWTFKEEDILIDLYNQGWSNKDIGTYLDRTSTAVSQHLCTVLGKKRSKDLRSKVAMNSKNRSIESEFEEHEEYKSDSDLSANNVLPSSMESILYDIIYRATYDAMKRALNE